VKTLRMLILQLLLCAVASYAFGMEDPDPNCCNDPVLSFEVEWIGADSDRPCEGDNCEGLGGGLIGVTIELTVTFECTNLQGFYTFPDYSGDCGEPMCDEEFIGSTWTIKYCYAWLPGNPIECGVNNFIYGSEQAIEEVPAYDKCDFPGKLPVSWSGWKTPDEPATCPSGQSWESPVVISTEVNCGEQLTIVCTNGMFYMRVGEDLVGHCPFDWGNNTIKYITQTNGCGGVRLYSVEHVVFDPYVDDDGLYRTIVRQYDPVSGTGTVKCWIGNAPGKKDVEVNPCWEGTLPPPSSGGS
jgi:hypothetical protein